MRPVLVIAALLVAFPVYAQPSDLAELFPADSIVYIEVNQPGAVGKELTEFLKGSTLVKGSATAKTGSPWSSLRKSIFGPEPSDAVPNNDGTPQAIITSIFGADMLKEAERFKGMAAALTGFDKRGEPQYVAILLPGTSKLPSTVMRTYLSMHGEIRKFATVEGVDLYQEANQVFNDEPLKVDNPVPKTIPIGPIYGYNSNVVIFGSNKELISTVLRRWNGKSKDKKNKSEVLADRPLFKEAAEQYRAAPGIFVYAEAAPLQQRLIAMRKKSPNPETLESVAFRKLLPQGSVRRLAGRLEVKDSELIASGSLKLDAKTAAPMADLLQGSNLALTDLNAVARETPIGLTLRLPSGEQRAGRFLAVLDLLIKASGSLGPTASEIVEELEQKKILSAATIAQVDRLTVVMPHTARASVGLQRQQGMSAPGAAMPVILFHTESEQAAASLESALPSILELFGAVKSDPVVEHILGVTIRSLDARTVPLGVPFHFGSHGKSFAIGVDRKLVAACLAADPVRGAASMTEVADAFKSADRPGALGLWNWSESFRTSRLDLNSATTGSVSGAPGTSPFEMRFNGRYYVRTQAEQNAPRRVFEPLAGVPPLTATIGRRQDEIRFELRQRDPNRLRIKTIDRWLQWHKAVSSGNFGGSVPYSPEMDIDGPGPIFLPGGIGKD